ncbi:MAG: Na-Ca exchanger/integrin-beta4 [Pedosphaera sp.]|nr:Na-Ca exchanger/integrin-beta4 [Pedosphaera sp.]
MQRCAIRAARFMKPNLDYRPARVSHVPFARGMLLCALLALNVNTFAAEKLSTWQTDVSGMWTDSYRWSTPVYPDNSGTNLYSATIDMPSRTVTLDRNVTLESFNLSRGALGGSNAPAVTLNQQLHLGAAQLIGNGLLSANGLSITGATKVVRGWTVENRGIGNWLEGDLRIGDGAKIFNSATAGLNANFDGTIVNDLGGTALFENAGMFRKSAGTNQTKIYVPFLNTGALEVDSGALAFYGNSTNIGGKIEMLPGASLMFTGLRHTIDASSKIYGLGGIVFDNGTVDFNGIADVQGPITLRIGTVNLNPACTVTQFGSALVFTGSGTLNVNSGEPIFWNSLTISNGLIAGSDSLHTGNGGFQWRGGTFMGSGHLDIDGSSVFGGGAKTLRGWVVENHGALQWNSSDIFQGEGARFVNLPGGSVQMSSDGGWLTGYSGGAYFDNFGAVQKSGGTNSTIGVQFYNEGLVEVAAGNLRFGNTLTNKGALSVASGATLVFAASSIQLTALGSLDGDGSVSLENGTVVNSGSFRAAAGSTLKSGTLRFINGNSRPNLGAALRFTGTATLDASSGYTLGVPTLLQTNGTISGSDTLVVSNLWVCSNGDLDGTGNLELRGQSLVNGGPRWTGRRVVNRGQLDWAGGDIDAGLGFVFHNMQGASVYVDSDRNFTTSYGGNTMFLNEGTVLKYSSGTNQFNLPFVNNGQLYMNAGRIQFNGGFNQTNGLLALNGTAVGSPKTLVNSVGAIAGSGDIFASVFNADTLAVGWGNQIGHLNISGVCTQAVTATLQIELAATNQFDSVAITGQANLNGKLEIGLLNGFVPPDGSSFPILTSATCIGQFSQVTGADLPAGRKLIPVYNATGVTLIVTNVFPPPLLTITRPSDTNAIQVSWPAGYDNWSLQSRTDLTGTNWTDLPPTGTNFAIIPTTTPVQFFRLRQGQ